MIHRLSDRIRPVVSLATPAVIVLEIVVELERLPALQSHAAVQAPAVLQSRKRAASVRQVVAEDPSKALGQIKVRRPVFEEAPHTVVRLRGVGLEVFAVARVIHRTRPNIVNDRRDAVPPVQAQAALQGIVIGLPGGVFVHDVKGRAIRSVSVNIGNAVVTSNAVSEVIGVNGRLARLIDVEKPPEPVTMRTDVSNLQDNVFGNLLLNIEVVVHHERRFDVLVEAEGVALVSAGGGWREHRRAGGDRPTHGAGRNYR